MSFTRFVAPKDMFPKARYLESRKPKSGSKHLKPKRPTPSGRQTGSGRATGESGTEENGTNVLEALTQVRAPTAVRVQVSVSEGATLRQEENIEERIGVLSLFEHLDQFETLYTVLRIF